MGMAERRARGPCADFLGRVARARAPRRYGALRAYLAEGLSAAEAAARFGYTPVSLLSAVRDFRAGAREFFVTGRPGPKTAPAKDAARPRIIELRAAAHSIDEIAEALAAEGTPLNRTGIAEVIADEGLPRLWRRPDAERRGPAREIPARAEGPGPGRPGTGPRGPRAPPRAKRSPGPPTPSCGGAGPGPGRSTPSPAGPSAPARCSPSSPKTPPPTPSCTPTPTYPRPARTAR